MRLIVLICVLLPIGFIPSSLLAFPPAIAKKILGRPIGGNLMDSEFKEIAVMFDAIIEGGEGAIRISTYSVGEPLVKLSVLIVEPRHYGFKITDSLKMEKGTPTYSFDITSVALEKAEWLNEKYKEVKPDSDGTIRIQLTMDEMLRGFKEQAHVGSRKKSTDDPRTVFLLQGYGVSKKSGLPLALLLANHGIRTVMPDLRGQGDSTGKGLSWGKHEPGDLADLLSALQRDKVVAKEKEVAVVGISYGAAMASLWSAQDSRVQHTVLVAPYKQVDLTIISAVDGYKDSIKVPFVLTRKGVSKGTEIAAKRLKMSWQELSTAKAVPEIGTTVLFATSTKDTIAPSKEVEELFRLAPEGSKLHVFKDVPHELLGVNFNAMESLIVDWFKSTGFIPE